MQIDWPEGAASTRGAPALWRPLRKTTAAVDNAIADVKTPSTVECNNIVIGAVLIGGLAIVAGLGYLAT